MIRCGGCEQSNLFELRKTQRATNRKRTKGETMNHIRC